MRSLALARARAYPLAADSGNGEHSTLRIAFRTRLPRVAAGRRTCPAIRPENARRRVRAREPHVARETQSIFKVFDLAQRRRDGERASAEIPLSRVCVHNRVYVLNVDPEARAGRAVRFEFLILDRCSATNIWLAGLRMACCGGWGSRWGRGGGTAGASGRGAGRGGATARGGPWVAPLPIRSWRDGGRPRPGDADGWARCGADSAARAAHSDESRGACVGDFGGTHGGCCG